MIGLVLSGGGARGSFQVGVLKAILEHAPFYEPKVIVGTSVGALNAAWLSQFPIGQFKAGVAALEALWLNIKGNSSIYDTRTFGQLAALWRPSVYVQDPLRRLLKTKLDIKKVRASGRICEVCAVSLVTGKAEYFNQDDEFFVDGVLASSAFPVMFEPVLIRGAMYTDGGVREIAPLDRAHALGATTADVIMCSPAEAFSCPARPLALDVFHAVLDSMSNEVAREDLTSNSRWLFEPRQVIIENSLNFDPALIRKNIQHGYEVAKTRLAKETHT